MWVRAMMKESDERKMTRRRWLRSAGQWAAVAAAGRFVPAYAYAEVSGAAIPQRIAAGDGVIDLSVDEYSFRVNGRSGNAVALNGSVPGPLVRLREGETAVLRVANHLNEATSIHWHGLIVPADMDGVPGVSFAGIKPGETFTYRFPVRQSGTYWAHSHSGGQELQGLYFPLIIDPIEPEPFQYGHDYVVMLSDWSFESPATIIGKLKKQAGYYNFQKRTLGDFVHDLHSKGLGATIDDRLSWSKMRMDPTDFADVTGYTYSYLMNGLTPEGNWTGLFRPGESMRLRVIAAGAMTYFDVRIPGLKMTVVQADGQNVQPVEVDEFRIAPGETFDVIVRPEDRPYTLFAETMDRSGYASGTLTPRIGMRAAIPTRRARPLRTMADMGMDSSSMAGMDMSATSPGADVPEHHAHGVYTVDRERAKAAAQTEAGDHAAHRASAAVEAGLRGPSLPGSPAVPHGPDTHGAGNSSIPQVTRNRLSEPGSGFEHTKSRVLVYTDLRSFEAAERHEPSREIELHITGNMERYIWSFDGKKYSQASEPIAFHYGERLRLILVNDTMMEHPIHLHGMWMELENGAGEHQPRKHTVSVKPAERVTLAITADAPGQWALHCHLLLHMEMGMFRVVEVHQHGAPLK